MRTQTIELFNISELSEKALETAHQNYLSAGFEYFWVEESLSSIRVFLDHFGAKVTDYSLSPHSHSWINTDLEQVHVRGMSARFWPDKEKELTGFCLDFTLLDAFYKAVKPKGDVLGAIKEAVEAGQRSIIEDMEYQESLEYFKEMAEENDWEYTSNGLLWR